MGKSMDLTDVQWDVVKGILPPLKRRPDGKGRPWRDSRPVLNGILWILRTGAPWKDLPERYPPYQTCHRRFQQWNDEGVLDDIIHVLAKDLLERGKLDLSEAYIDGSFASAKKGVVMLVKLSAEKGPRSWQLSIATVFLSPLGLQALRRMKLPLLKRPSKTALPMKSLQR